MSNEIQDDLFDGRRRDDSDRPRRKRRGRKILLGFLIAFLVLVVGVIAVIALYINGLSRSYDENVTAVPDASASAAALSRTSDSSMPRRR